MYKNKLGIAITVLWLLIMVSFAIWKGQSFVNMGANEFGDFFAGFLAPLAFLWLVLGYFQQNQTIQQNTEVLKAQLDDLRAGMKLRKEKVQPSFDFGVGTLVDIITNENRALGIRENRFNIVIKNNG